MRAEYDVQTILRRVGGGINTELLFRILTYNSPKYIIITVDFNKISSTYIQKGDFTMKFKGINIAVLFILMSAIVFSLFACGNGSTGGLAIDVGDYSITANAVYDNGGNEVKKIEILKEDEVMQTIVLPEEESITIDVSKPLYAVDVSFDGVEDIIVPAEGIDNKTYCYAYVWDNSIREFVLSPGFVNISCFAIDKEEKRILSKSIRDNGTTTYSFYAYDASQKDFILEAYLTYYPTGENDTYYLKEVDLYNGTETVVNEYTFSGGDIKLVAKVDPNIGRYFEKGSKWDLESTKWQPAISD